MPTYYARKAGNVNAADVWATTPSGTAGDFFSSFTSADVLMSNSFMVTVNVNTTVGEIRNDTTGGATAGGAFSLTSGVTLTANAFTGTGPTAIITYVGSGTASIVGNLTSVGGAGLYHSSIGTVNITGDVRGGSVSNNIHCVFINAGGVVNITGNVTGGSSPSSLGVFATGGNGTLNITGTVTGGTGSSSHGVQSGGTSTTTITGTVVGAVGGSTGLTVVNSSNATVVGVAVGGPGATGAANTGTGLLTVTRAKGNGFGNGSVGATAQVGVAATQTSPASVYEIEYGDLGQSPVSGPITFINATTNAAVFYRPPSGTKKTLIDAASTAGLFPAVADVRSGVSYNSGSLTGTCAVPSPNAVSFGVAVGATTGVAVLTPSAVESAIGSFSSGRLQNCATVASVGEQIASSVAG